MSVWSKLEEKVVGLRSQSSFIKFYQYILFIPLENFKLPFSNSWDLCWGSTGHFYLLMLRIPQHSVMSFRGYQERTEQYCQPQDTCGLAEALRPCTKADGMWQKVAIAIKGGWTRIYCLPGALLAAWQVLWGILGRSWGPDASGEKLTTSFHRLCDSLQNLFVQVT